MVKSLAFDEAVEAPKEEPMLVSLRVRPLEGARKISVVEELPDGSSVKITAPKSSAAYKAGEREETFHFAQIFGVDSTQEQIYQKVALPVVGSLLSQESHGFIFSYGVTNSGKTYTIHGTAAEPGILPRALKTIFNSIRRSGPDDDRFSLDDKNYKYAVVVNYLEIYNEMIFDLLADFSKDKMDIQKESLELKMDSKQRVGVRGLRDVTVSTYEQAMQILEQGRTNRQVAETKLNTDSSRSHSIFTIKLCTVPKEHVVPMKEVQENPGKYVRYTKLSVIDLAGSERAKRTNNQGARLVEANNINQSLLTFKRCLDALRHNQLHPNRPKQAVPFRDSKMTRLFQDYFSNGTGRAVMLVNVNPQVSDYDETSRVLKFSAMAQDIRVITSRIDTGRTNKTRARTEGFSGDPSLVGVESAKEVPAAGAVESSKKIKRGGAAPLVPPAAATAPVAAPRSADIALEQQAAAEMETLRAELLEAKTAAIRMEAQIREEVAEEFAQEIFRNQLQCEERVVEIREALEEKYERKIQILDELNKTNMQRHAIKYQELVEEYNSLADEFDAREAELQEKIDQILAANDSGSASQYTRIIAGLEEQIKVLTARTSELEVSKQEWKKQMGHMAETRIAQLEKEAAELREENNRLRSHVESTLDKKTVKSIWGLKRKQKSGENLIDEAKEEDEREQGWATVALDDDESKDKAKQREQKKKFGSWRKRKAAAPALQQTSSGPGSKVLMGSVGDDAALEVLRPKNGSPPKRSKPAAKEAEPRRMEEDSLQITDLLHLDQNTEPRDRTSPLLQKRSISRASTQLHHNASGDVPVIVPATGGGSQRSRGAKKASKYAF